MEFSDDQIEEFKEAFALFDRDGNGEYFLDDSFDYLFKLFVHSYSLLCSVISLSHDFVFCPCMISFCMNLSLKCRQRNFNYNMDLYLDKKTTYLEFEIDL